MQEHIQRLVQMVKMVQCIDIYGNNIQCKYMKGYSYNINIQTFNIILIDVHNSLLIFFGFYANFLSHIIIGNFNIDMFIKTQHNQMN
jgi:hypothetical protein